MNASAIKLLIALAITVAWQILLVVLYNISDAGTFQRIIIMLGGSMPAGVIQATTFFLFTYGLIEVTGFLKETKRQASFLKKGWLPEKDNWVIHETDVTNIRLKMHKVLSVENSILADIIKKACNKYRSDKSAADALVMVSQSAALQAEKNENKHTFIRYVLWAIPSVGFIGTVLGIAGSLEIADQAALDGGIEKITSILGVAFDTTLVSLFLSIILMYFYNTLDQKSSSLLNDIQEYVIENLINRIYK